jgi:hypothetical protein
MQIPDGHIAPDPFDPLKADARWSNPGAPFHPFLLRPLIFSAGPDRVYDIYTDRADAPGPFRYAVTTPPNDPYAYIIPAMGGDSVWMGTPVNYATSGDPTVLEHSDNITNHAIGLEGQ